MNMVMNLQVLQNVENSWPAVSQEKIQLHGVSRYGCNEQWELAHAIDVIVDVLLFQVAMATGQVLFQRFYYSKSFVRHAMETTAMGCVCLASKIEEAPRRIRDVINVFHHIKQVKSQK
jgi:hypothetical protein